MLTRARSFRSVLSMFSLGFLVIGCGGNTGGGTQPPSMSGSTAVSLMLTSTSNGHLSRFNLGFTGISLTNQAGKTVPLLTMPENPEFTHLNGITEPLGTVSVPDDVYTSATATFASADFVCVDLNSTGGLQTNSYIGDRQIGAVTFNLPSPLTIQGGHMGLLLDLLISQSLSYPGCDQLASGSDIVTPTFILTSMTFAAQPTNSSNGLVTDLEGTLGLLNSSSRSIQLKSGDGLSWTLTAGSSTMYQGVSDFSGLATGLPVAVDAAIQADGSLAATRIAVLDTNTTTLTATTGPLLQIASVEPALVTFAPLWQGYLPATGTMYYSFGNTTFGISGPPANLQSLPFAATFTGTNMVPGQRIYATTNSTINGGGPLYTPLATITLVPQTLNGTVASVSNDGSFATYTINLAPYDLFDDLAVQAGQTTLLNNPSTAVIYVDSSVQMLNTNPLAAGSKLRFYGLVFNDHGTLKMDCTQISDGVSQ